jgi:hypothetical protein
MVISAVSKSTGHCIDCGATLAESSGRNRTVRCASCGCRRGAIWRRAKERAAAKAAAKPADIPDRGG